MSKTVNSISSQSSDSNNNNISSSVCINMTKTSSSSSSSTTSTIKTNINSSGCEQLKKLTQFNSGYGRPSEGSKTLERAKKAHAHVSNEVKYLCEIIRDSGVTAEDGTVSITFGRLFKIYVAISDKVVGMLLRARKYGFVDFDGEMLYQGQDDQTIIRLIKMPPKDFGFKF